MKQKSKSINNSQPKVNESSISAHRDIQKTDTNLLRISVKESAPSRNTKHSDNASSQTSSFQKSLKTLQNALNCPNRLSIKAPAYLRTNTSSNGFDFLDTYDGEISANRSVITNPQTPPVDVIPSPDLYGTRSNANKREPPRNK